MLFVWLYQAFRLRNPYFFRAANPTFPNGGLYRVSKKKIYDLIPPDFYPATRLLNHTDEPDLSLLEAAGISFPCIAKPDLGLRGKNVCLLHNREEWDTYRLSIGEPYLVQALIHYPHEIGLFYVRKPHEKRGRITGVVGKEFLRVCGNGKNTVRELLLKTPRHALQISSLNLDWDEIPAAGESRTIVPFGNHSRGTMFLDESLRINDRLTRTIDDLCTQIPGFYYGRIDLRFESWEKLEQGTDFQIVEVNGAMSEPAHIYDPKHGYGFALREIYRHHKLMFEVCEANLTYRTT